MQKNFKFSLTGGSWFPIYLILYVVFAGCMAAIAGISARYVGIKTVPAFGWDIVIAIACGLVLFLTILALAVPIYRKFIGGLELDGKPFRFYGSAPEFVWLNVWQLFLTLITLGIYYAWYINRMGGYIASNTEYDGKRLNWNGKGGDLFPTMLWAFYLPTILLSVYSGMVKPEHAGNLNSLFYNFLSQILYLPLGYKLYQWMFNHTAYETKTARWDTEFWPSMGKMAGQTVLTFITFFIYWPAAFLKIYRYFAPKTKILENGQEKGHFVTTYTIGEGFLLLWGQTLLCIITLGIYVPWAAARIGRFMAEKTQYEVL